MHDIGRHIIWFLDACRTVPAQFLNFPVAVQAVRLGLEVIDDDAFLAASMSSALMLELRYVMEKGAE